MTHKTVTLAGFALCALAGALAAPAAFAEPTYDEVHAVMKRDFHTRGQATIDRVDQDGIQRLCTQTRDKPPENLARALENEQHQAIRYPADGKLMGDWKRGAKIAASGTGMTWKEKAGSQSGGGCYNCHQLSPKQPSYGTVGPSLKHYAKVRGSGMEGQKYVYGKIYNSKAYNLCTQMPRFGSSGTLTEQDIKDLVGYLLDPTSPVNE